jgi:hypothetical protein
MRTANFVAPYQWILPALIALFIILLASLIKEPARQKVMALLIAGAGTAYLSGGGFGVWEIVFCTLLSVVAYFGLRSYSMIGIGWLLHTAWDIAHHLYGNPILPFDLTSSLGCAICDPMLALWCFAGAPSLWGVLGRKRVPETPLSA